MGNTQYILLFTVDRLLFFTIIHSLHCKIHNTYYYSLYHCITIYLLLENTGNSLQTELFADQYIALKSRRRPVHSELRKVVMKSRLRKIRKFAPTSKKKKKKKKKKS